MAELGYPFHRADDVRDTLGLARLYPVKYCPAHVLVAWLVYVYKGHLDGSRCAHHVVIDVGVHPHLDAVLQPVDCLFCNRLGDAVLHHVLDVPVENFVKVDCRHAYRVVGNYRVAAQILCKQELGRPHVDCYHHFADVFALDVHGAVCRHLFPARKLQSHLHYSASVYASHAIIVSLLSQRGREGAKFKSVLAAFRTQR
ncbi:MAG: hypothetical protein C4292_00380 [Nitrososphaera sp.]